MEGLRGLVLLSGLGLLLGSPLIAAPRPLPDGDYLFGEAPRPGELGRTYLVLRLRRGQFEGAMYMPRSSFDCVEGRVVGGDLQLRIRDSYTREPTELILTLNPRRGSPDGFHRLTPQSNDLRMIETCRRELTAGS